MTQLLRFQLLTLYGKWSTYPPSEIHVQLPASNAPDSGRAASIPDPANFYHRS